MNKNAQEHKMRKLLQIRHKENDGWLFFNELRNRRGYKGPIRTIDCFAFNMWASKKHWRVAYELKTSHADFLNELKQPAKRDAFYQYSNEFYFVAPVGIIPVSELPEGCGLMELNKKSLRIKQHAMQRECEDLPMDITAAMVANKSDVDIFSHNKLRHMKYWKYAGIEISEKELNKIVGDFVAKDLYYKIKEMKSDAGKIVKEHPWLKIVGKYVGCSPQSYNSEFALNEFLENVMRQNKMIEDTNRLYSIAQDMKNISAEIIKDIDNEIEKGESDDK